MGQPTANAVALLHSSIVLLKRGAPLVILCGAIPRRIAQCLCGVSRYLSGPDLRRLLGCIVDTECELGLGKSPKTLTGGFVAFCGHDPANSE